MGILRNIKGSRMRKVWLVVIGLVTVIVLFGVVGDVLLGGKISALPGLGILQIFRPLWMAPQQFKASKIFYPGSLGYGIAMDVTKPGKVVGISFYAWKQNEVILPGPIEFKLEKISVYGKTIKVISQEIREIKVITPEWVIWQTGIPDVAPANYRLSVVLRDEKGDVFGKLMSTLYVPPQELNATISLNKTEFRSGETLKLTIKNKGPTTITFGSTGWGDYTIEYLHPDGEWRKSEAIWWPYMGGGPLIVLRPRKSLTQSIEVPSSPAGTYRIGKGISAEGTNLSTHLTKTFTIIADPGTY